MAVVTTRARQGVHAVEVCTDPGGNGHANPVGEHRPPGSGSGGPSELWGRSAPTSSGGLRSRGTRVMNEATETRRESTRALPERRTAAKTALRHAAGILADDPHTAHLPGRGGLTCPGQPECLP